MQIMRIRSAALCLLLCFLLSGCRESPVLQETIYQHTAPLVDETQEMLDPENQGQEDEDFSNEIRDDAETPRDTEQDMGLTEQDTEAPAQDAVDILYNENARDDLAPASAPPQPSPAPSPQPTAGAGSASPQPSSDPGELSPAASPSAVPTQTPEVTDSPEITESPEITAPPEEIHYRQIVDAAGRTVEIPEQAATVTATGTAAQLVELLGGSGRLVGADVPFASAALAGTVYSDLANVNLWWNGGVIDDGSFEALLEKTGGKSGDFRF
mgnify:CR=1 FL=1